MLDECRGERLEEVLAAFSSAVLKHVVSDDLASSGKHPALALELALEERGYKGETTELDTLDLAHKVSLHGLLRSKKAANAQFRDFSDLLNVKERGISRRNEAVHAREHEEGSKTVSDDAKLETWRTIRNNWSGNEKWMETLLYGDAGAKKDGLFNMPFDRVWRRVQQGRLSEVEESSSGLLEQLDNRVKVQKERLQKWEGFRKTMGQDQPAPTPSKQKRPRTGQRGIDLGFGAHEGLQFGRASPRKATIGHKSRRLNPEYANLIDGLYEELADLEPNKSSNVLAILQRPRSAELPRIEAPRTSLGPEDAEQEATSEVSELEDFESESFQTEAPIKTFQAKLQHAKRLPVRPRLSDCDDSYTSNRTASRTSSDSRSLRKQLGQETPNYCTTSSELSQSPDLPRVDIPSSVTSVAPQSPKEEEEEEIIPPPSPIKDDPLSPTQQLADQILESMNQASPSPTKRTKPRHTLSLAERTRMSMSRGSLAFPDDDSELMDHTATIPSIAEDDTLTLTVEEPEDLASRTRRSMVGFDKARQKAQMERRRSLRKSKMPPRREGSHFPTVEEDPEQTVLTEELMTVEDMEAVFRSRPKVKASPVQSPTKEWEGEDYL